MSLARRSPFKQFEGLTMHVFLTGATGFIGSMIVRELIGAGHQVTGLTRSDEGARQLDRFRARAHRGTIEDPASVVSGLSEADAVRTEEHTSELQSLMRISYAVICLTKKK